MPDSQSGRRLALFLSTTAFALCFVAWGLISPLAPVFRDLYQLSNTEVGLLVAVPVLLGSLARVPFGALTERYGGRAMFSVLLAFLALPLALTALTGSFAQLLLIALFLGVAGASFAIGIPFVSAWFPPERQGTALGIYGTGNIGTAIAAIVAPRVAEQFGWPWVFWSLVPLLLLSAGLMWVAGRDSPRGVRSTATLASRLKVIREAPLSWVLLLFYFVTFGAFVAIGAMLPSLLVGVYHLTPTDAGARAAGFILLATIMRPVGGALSDRLGAPAVLNIAFPIITALAVLLAFEPAMSGATIGYLGIATALGLGNGAVFKLVAVHFPGQTGTIGGFVGAAGGLGGFFPPLILGVVRDATGSTAIGLMLLSEFALVCLMINLLVLQRGAWKLLGTSR